MSSHELREEVTTSISPVKCTLYIARSREQELGFRLNVKVVFMLNVYASPSLLFEA